MLFSFLGIKSHPLFSHFLLSSF
uniref:Uncharacterized protein n=1 Tax=Anguilla anguilla TaxID=7936 RepID=A0A0E9SQA3_ANGAN